MATVIDPDADADQESFRVQLENGEEQVISYESFGILWQHAFMIFLDSRNLVRCFKLYNPPDSSCMFSLQNRTG